MKWVIFAGGTLCLVAAPLALIGAQLPVKHYAARKARPEKNGRKLWWEEDRHGQKITCELVEDAPPVRRVTRIADAGLPFGGTWTYEIAPLAAGGSEVRIAEAGEACSVFFRFVSRFVVGYAGSIEWYLWA